jgi:integrase/recombinase XerD
MDRAIAEADANGAPSVSSAMLYRDGLIIAFLALIPLRSRTFAALRIGRQLRKIDDIWDLEIPPQDTKSRRPLDYSFTKELSDRIDMFINRFRRIFLESDSHASAWPSRLGNPMTADAIYGAVYRQTSKAFGFGVSLHRFRHAAASFWSIHDPNNVRGVKDLLGHASFNTTERYYVMTQSRLAGQVLAGAVKRLAAR